MLGVKNASLQRDDLNRPAHLSVFCSNFNPTNPQTLRLKKSGNTQTEYKAKAFSTASWLTATIPVHLCRGSFHLSSILSFLPLSHWPNNPLNLNPLTSELVCTIGIYSQLTPQQSRVFTASGSARQWRKRNVISLVNLSAFLRIKSVNFYLFNRYTFPYSLSIWHHADSKKVTWASTSEMPFWCLQPPDLALKPTLYPKKFWFR